MDYNIDEEVWKDVIGYEGLYEVSSFGRIRSGKSKRIRKLNSNRGYYLINLSKNAKQRRYSVHRLVAKAFIANPDNKREVNHIDEDKKNNHISNLCWVTAKENSNWGTRNKRISEYVKANFHKSQSGRRSTVKKCCINTGETIATYDSVSEASQETGVHQPNISSCINGKKKTAGGYKWERIF